MGLIMKYFKGPVTPPKFGIRLGWGGRDLN